MLKAVVLALVAGTAACSTDTPRDATASGRRWRGDSLAERVRAVAISDLAQLDSSMNRLMQAARTVDGSAERVEDARQRFFEARDAWKTVEWLVEAYTPTSAEQLNGPPLPEVEYTEGHQPERPADGFQVVEGMLWPATGRVDGPSVEGEVATMRQTLERVRQILSANVLLDGTVWDAGRQELARISTLGLAGFDSPVVQRQLVEARRALAGVARAIDPYRVAVVPPDEGQWTRLMLDFRRADSALGQAVDADQPDHWMLLQRHLLPLARQYAVVQQALRIRLPDERRVWRVDAATPFERNALDVMAYAGPSSVAMTPARVALGEALAYAPVLSGDGSRSCVTCHDPSKGYADGVRVRVALRTASPAHARNTPTLLNAALQSGLFADQRVVYLEDQVTDVVGNPAELHGDLSDAAERLARLPAVRERFAEAFAEPGQPVVAESLVTAQRIRQAIATWERSLVRLDSRFDRGARGDTSAMTGDERRGFNLFMGKGKCGSCHFPPLFGGAIPPAFQKMEFEVLGTPSTAVWRNARVDADPGRAGVTNVPMHAHAFKTPALRNVGVTAPYMHNGVYRTLDDVIEFYARGGGHGIGARLEHQTLPTDRIEFTAAERVQLIAFLHTLTDTSAVSRAPAVPLPATAGRLVDGPLSQRLRNPSTPAGRGVAAPSESRPSAAR